MAGSGLVRSVTVTDEPDEQLTLYGEAELDRWWREGFEDWDVFDNWRPSRPRGEEAEGDEG
jgi:hypothetical protein